MKVVITRPDKHDIRIWRTDNPDNLVVNVGGWYVRRREAPDMVSMDLTRDGFKDLFGFLPKIGSKKVYQLNLKLFTKI